MSREKQNRPEIKKGRTSWKPSSLNEFNNKEPGFRYRMVRKDPENLSRKAQEGWETVSAIQSPETEHVLPGRMHDGKSLTSVNEGRDWILQRIPEELAQERDAYYNNENQRRVAGLTSHLKREIKNKGGDAPVHGEITISSRSGTQVIE